ncbi:branched-chain amino acid transport system II carrier protein, partial [Klebsiella pneumoniae]|uniref:branched-chain amino acid transport system II carrier protein n=1 Tax=Klebsiella pneumoniae TaxID=573 RepID=UPI0027315EE9
FGGAGRFLLAALIFIACLGTAGGLTFARAGVFSPDLPFSHRPLGFFLGLFSTAGSHFGPCHLSQVSIPGLTAIYPPGVALVVF